MRREKAVCVRNACPQMNARLVITSAFPSDLRALLFISRDCCSAHSQGCAHGKKRQLSDLGVPGMVCMWLSFWRKKGSSSLHCSCGRAHGGFLLWAARAWLVFIQ